MAWNAELVNTNGLYGNQSFTFTLCSWNDSILVPLTFYSSWKQAPALGALSLAFISLLSPWRKYTIYKSSCTVGSNVKLVQLLWKTVWRFLRKLKVELPYDPATPGHIPRQNCNSKRYMHPPIFMAALFTIAKTQKPPKCPSAYEQIKEMWYESTMEYYSAVKKTNESRLQQHGWT